MNVDDLLRELDDLPTGAKSKPPVGAGAPAQQQYAHHHARNASLPSNTQAGSRQSQQAAAAPPHSGTSSSSGGVGGSGSSSTLGRTPSAHGRAHSVPRAAARSELDELFDDLDIDTGPTTSAARAAVPPAASERHGPVGKSSSAIASRQKCSMLFVGGARFGRGRMGAVGQTLCCDSLRCTKCDFKVVQFLGLEWDADVDYLFFRNNYPTEPQLAPKMSARPQAVAYCCQCSWLTALEDKKLDFASELRWVCGGHLHA